MGSLWSFSLFPRCCGWVGCKFAIWDGTQVRNLSHIIIKFLSHSHSKQWYFVDHLIVGYEWSEHQWIVSNHPNLKDFLRFYLHAQTHYHNHHHLICLESGVNFLPRGCNSFPSLWWMRSWSITQATKCWWFISNKKPVCDNIFDVMDTRDVCTIVVWFFDFVNNLQFQFFFFLMLEITEPWVPVFFKHFHNNKTLSGSFFLNFFKITKSLVLVFWKFIHVFS